jgi:transcriptional regulator with XRE-family HTH domain
MNPIKKLRAALEVTQQQLAAMTELSLSSISSYERGTKPEARSLQILVDLALKNSLGGLAAELRNWRGSEESPPTIAPLNTPGLKPLPAPHYRRWHAMLESVLESRNPKAIAAVTSNLEFLYDHVGSGPFSAKPAPRKKGRSA